MSQAIPYSKPLDFDLILANNTVRLRPMREKDFQSFLALTQADPLWKYFTQDLADKQTLRDWMEEGLTLKNQNKRLPFTIESLSGEILGSTSFGNISMRDQRLEIGWTWLGRRFHGKGINDQVKFLMLEYAFEQLNFIRVECKTDVLNQPARNALERIGFVAEGVLRSHTLMTRGRRRDTIYFSILQQEWPAVKQRLQHATNRAT